LTHYKNKRKKELPAIDAMQHILLHKTTNKRLQILEFFVFMVDY